MNAARLAALGAAVALASAAPCAAETLAEAIAYAYDSNPTLVSQRAQLQATDETYVQAKAGFRPTITAQASTNYTKSPQLSLFGGRFEEEMNTGTAILALNQPIYTGGRVTAQVRGAEAQVRAGREQLRATETQVIQGVVQAYADVVRDRASLDIQREGLKQLAEETAEIQARHEAGAATVTDVNQAQAQLEAARAQVQTAQAQLETSEAEYLNNVGHTAADLAPFPALPGVPPDLDKAFDAAERENPQLRQSQFNEAAYRAQIQQARAQGAPNIGASAQFGYTGPAVPAMGNTFDRTVTLSATLTQPIFTGGVVASQVREATALDTAARVQVEAVRRNVVQAVSQSWSQRRAAQQNIKTEAAEVVAAQATFDGERVEYRAGLRDTLDLLIAQETLTGARVSLAQAQHDEALDTALVLAAVGRLEARDLLVNVPLYAPEAAFKRVANKGAVPWEGATAALDRIGVTRPKAPAALPEPPAPDGPVSTAPPELAPPPPPG